MPGDVRSVLMTADAVGGVWTYAMELCAALGGRGVRVALVVQPCMVSQQGWVHHAVPLPAFRPG